MRDQIEDTIRHTRRYWNIDGLAELGLGLLCLIMAAYFTLQSFLEPGTLLSQLLNLFLILLVMGGGLASNRLITYFKKKITYPRTGYVKYRSSARYRRILLGLAAVIIAAALVIVLSFTDMKSFWMPLLTALIFSIVFTYVANQGFTPRYYVFALISLGLGVRRSPGRLERFSGPGGVLWRDRAGFIDIRCDRPSAFFGQ